ncbi:MAG: hypothetical protein QM729_18070 [Solirubrobacterales bacterium]
MGCVDGGGTQIRRPVEFEQLAESPTEGRIGLKSGLLNDELRKGTPVYLLDGGTSSELD